MRKLLNINTKLAVFFLFLTLSLFKTSWAMSENEIYVDKANLISQQIDLLQNRLIQSKNEIAKLQYQQDHQQLGVPLDHINKHMLSQAEIDIAVSKSNLDSINIELTESQQTISTLEKETQEIENQLNVYNIFGLKITSNTQSSINTLKMELDYQKKLLRLEKVRNQHLLHLRELASKAIQFYKTKQSRIVSLLKSQTMMQLKAQEAKSELGFQERQSYWLQQLNDLYNQLNQLQSSKPSNRSVYTKLESEIFFANENVNLTYLQLLIARYQDQIRQLKISITRSSSITLLGKINEQMQLLTKQLSRLNDLLKTRLDILTKRKSYLLQLKENAESHVGIVNLSHQYQIAATHVTRLNEQLTSFRGTLDQALEQELSSRQGLPGLNAKAWMDLGAELMLIPPMVFKVIKNLTHNFSNAVYEISYLGWMLFAILEMLFLGALYFLNYFLIRMVQGVPDHEYGHINLKWLSIKVLHRGLIDLAVIGTIAGLFFFCQIPMQNFSILINSAMIWLFFKMIISIARLCLVETVHHRAGHDVRLFYGLKWTFIIGGVVTALTVVIHQLPIVYEIKDLFCRMFLFFLLIVSLLILRSWELFPELILLHVHERHVYVKRIVRILGLIVPLILLINSAIGLFGFVNFVMTFSWYESVFLMVLVGYLVVRGLLYDAMEWISHMFIRHIHNGWLWTEAFLKPLDKVLRILLILCTTSLLFAFYGWDRQSAVVTFLTNMLHYKLVVLLNTPISPLSIIELFVMISCLIWAARWSREFMYRLLLSRTKDMGVRNSIAILTQYTIILTGVFICMQVLGIDFRALAVVAGMFSLGIGLGLRDLANNFVCGFLLLIERPLRVGDTVSINDHEGEVTHVGSRAVTIRTWDHMEVLVPNAEIFSKTFMNWTAKDHIVRTVFSIKINRHDRPHDVQTIIYDVLAKHKDVLREPIPEVFLKEMTDGLMEFEIRYFINLRHVKSRVGVRSEVLIAIWEVFESRGIKPPYPHHEIYVKGGMPLLETLGRV